MPLEDTTHPVPGRLVLTCILSATFLLLAPQANGKEVSFSRNILHVFSNNCFGCHGPDKAKRKAGLRLDRLEGATAKLKSGVTGLVPSNSSASAIYQRITSSDPEKQMPPKDSGKKLTPKEIATIKDWIDEGGEWGKHWSFELPKKAAIPETIDPDWAPRNTVDHFIHSRLQKEKMNPEPPANKETLLRRVTFDLTGLPPTIAELDSFLSDNSETAYESVVDRLLSSAHYGENMARIWLDSARYADTHGLHLDNERSIWPYRDWVINSFNGNQPFNQFTVEQLAGDLLPDPTVEQRVATGFNRCNVTTGEGGSIDAEYYVRYAVERVETTSTVWLGLTAGCANCHDHKFDPLSQKEFYQLFSYFYSLTEKAMDGNKLLPPPSMKAPTKLQTAEVKFLRDKIEAAQKQVPEITKSIQYEDPHAGKKLESPESRSEFVWIEDSMPPGAKPEGNEGDKSWQFVKKADGHPVFSGETSTVRTTTGLSQHFFSTAKPPLTIKEGDTLFAHVYLDPKNPPETVQLQFNEGSWNHRAFWGANKGHNAGRVDATNFRMGDLPEMGKWVRLEVPASTVGLKPGANLVGWAFTQFGGTVHWDRAGIFTVQLSQAQLASLSLWEQYRSMINSPALPEEVQDALNVTADQRNEKQRNDLMTYYFREVNPNTKSNYAPVLRKESEAKSRLTELEKSIPSTLIMEDRKEPRQAYILERGEYTQQREKVSPNIPNWIAPSQKDAPPNRLGLAQWLVSPEQPLTSRVTVNRFWQQVFGTGLVKTTEDFGLQGEQPSHPDLLDWLAVDFVESGWDVKRLMKILIMSSTYQQSSKVNPDKLQKDAGNRLLARGPRFRLDAESIRDQALSVSGLLGAAIGGRSVKPYQPAGLWKPVGFGGSNTSQFKQDSGSALYRRSMYTFWKRTSHPPSMAIFDAPNRETCMVRRARTNTPLQALVLMNDVQFFEAARKFGERVMREGGKNTEERVNFAFRSVLGRNPTESERLSLVKLYGEHHAEFSQNTDSANEILSAGESSADKSLNSHELASWTMITHLILNLSETVTRG